MLYLYYFKKGFGTSLSTTFCRNFWRKIFLIYILLSEQISLSGYLLEISSNMWIVIVYYPVCDIINFEIYLSFLIKPVYYMAKNSEQKLKYLQNKEFLRWNKKHLSSFLKDFNTTQKFKLPCPCIRVASLHTCLEGILISIWHLTIQMTILQRKHKNKAWDLRDVSEPCQTSKVKFFAKMLNGFQLLTIVFIA